jgi:hypothetical protein
MDSKNWREPQIRDGSLWNGQSCEDDTVDAVRDQADAVAACLASIGLAPTAVLPYLVLARRTWPQTTVRGVSIVGDGSVQLALVRLGRRLDRRQVQTTVEALDDACPPASRAKASVRVGLVSRNANKALNIDDAVESQQVLLERESIIAALIESAMREPIESWMT